MDNKKKRKQGRKTMVKGKKCSKIISKSGKNIGRSEKSKKERNLSELIEKVHKSPKSSSSTRNTFDLLSTKKKIMPIELPKKRSCHELENITNYSTIPQIIKVNEEENYLFLCDGESYLLTESADIEVILGEAKCLGYAMKPGGKYFLSTINRFPKPQLLISKSSIPKSKLNSLLPILQTKSTINVNKFMQAKVVIKLRPYSSKGKLLSSNINVNEKIEFIDIWRETINHFPLNSKRLKIMLSGPKYSGKNTFSTFVINNVLSRKGGPEIYFLDLDFMHSKYFAPGIISLCKVTGPILSNLINLKKGRNVEAISKVLVNAGSVRDCTVMFLNSVRHLYTKYKQIIKENSQLKSMLIIKSVPWVNGLGGSLNYQIFKIIKMDYILDFSNPASIDIKSKTQFTNIITTLKHDIQEKNFNLNKFEAANNLFPLIYFTEPSRKELEQMRGVHINNMHSSQFDLLETTKYTLNSKFYEKDVRILNELFDLPKIIDENLCNSYSINLSYCTSILIPFSKIKLFVIEGNIHMESYTKLDFLTLFNARLIALCHISDIEQIPYYSVLGHSTDPNSELSSTEQSIFNISNEIPSNIIPQLANLAYISEIDYEEGIYCNISKENLEGMNYNIAILLCGSLQLLDFNTTQNILQSSLCPGYLQGYSKHSYGISKKHLNPVSFQ